MAGCQDFVAKGITYRQLDFWSRRGYLKASNPDCGSGREKHWPEAELRVADVMYRLTKAGLTVKAAHTVARGQSELAPGVTVLVDGQVAA